MQAARGDAGDPVDTLWVTGPADVRYLTGSTEGASALLFGRNWAVLFTGKMFQVRVTREAPGVEVSLAPAGMYQEAATLLRKHKAKAVGIQATVLTVSQHESLSGALKGVALEHIGDAVAKCRAVKDEDEVRLVRKAVRIAEKAFRELTGQGADYFEGKTENALAAELDYRMRLAGADRQGFPGGTIVASGPSSFNCHHVPGSRRVKRGEPVLFDWGAEVQGYRSDITRVVFVGSVADKLREIYAVVLAAHDAAVAVVKAGVRCHTVDAAARAVIADAGYAEEFRHGLGHGFGLEIHEWPGFSKKPKDGSGITLRRNMLMTVEPGVYLEGIGGVRIEDDVLVTSDGCERLNRLPRKLERMVLR